MTDTRFLAEQIEHVPIDSITEHPDNPNEADVGGINDSVDALDGGFYQVIFVQRSTGRIVAGHGRWNTLRARGADTAPVVFLDVDDTQALRILVGDNEIPRRLSRADDTRVAEILAVLDRTRAGVHGTGFDREGYGDLVNDIAQNRASGLAPLVPDPRILIRLDVSDRTRGRWNKHRGGHPSDDEALRALLDRPDPLA